MVTSFTWKYVAGSGGPRQHVDSCSKSAVDKNVSVLITVEEDGKLYTNGKTKT